MRSRTTSTGRSRGAVRAPKKRYDAVVVGGGGHGLATAYYLAREHGMTNVAVLEKGWLGGGNTGRNTTIVRSNYHLDPNAHFYEFSLKLWEGLSHELNFNVMYSARGVLNLVHSPADIDAAMRRGNAMRLNGIDARVPVARRDRAWIPNLDCSADARFPILGGLLQPRGGTVRHDAVAWGYARAADALGVDIIQNCEVTGIRVEGGAVAGVDTTQGFIATPKLGHRRRRSFGPRRRDGRDSGCRSSRTCCRRWCRSRSSRCSTPS